MLRSALPALALAPMVAACAPAGPASPNPPPPPVTATATPTALASADAAPKGSASAAASAAQAPLAGPTGPEPPPHDDPLASKDADRAGAVVNALPGVKGLCAESVSRGASSCGAWATEAPSEACRDDKLSYRNRDCWWGVGLFEMMTYPDGQGGHANRMATFYVDPKTFEVKGASTFECADLLFTLPAFRALKTRKAPPKSDDEACAGALPYPRE